MLENERADESIGRVYTFVIHRVSLLRHIYFSPTAAVTPYAIRYTDDFRRRTRNTYISNGIFYIPYNKIEIVEIARLVEIVNSSLNE